MPAGKIRNLVEERGFGFIAPEDGSKNIFFHCSALVECEFASLKAGQSVTYDVHETEKGPRAVNVELA